MIGHDCQILNTFLGKYSSIGNQVFIGVGRHAYNELSTSAAFYVSDVFNNHIDRVNSVVQKYNTSVSRTNILNDVHIGNNVSIINDLVINPGAIVKSNTILTKDVPPYAIVKGHNKIIGYRYSDEVISDLLDLKWWELDIPQMMQRGLQIPNNVKDFISVIKDIDPQDKIGFSQDWFAFSKENLDNQLTIVAKKISVYDVFRMIKYQRMII